MKDLNAAAHVYAAVISQVSEKNSALLLESLLSELKSYQNIVADLMQSFKPLHKFTVHYIETENEDISYEFLYNLSSKKLKML